MKFEGENVAPSTIVDLEVSFKLKLGMVVNDTVEFAFPGFKADFENTSDIVVESTITLSEESEPLANDYWIIPPYEPLVDEELFPDTDAVPGCFKYYVERGGDRRELM